MYPPPGISGKFGLEESSPELQLISDISDISDMNFFDMNFSREISVPFLAVPKFSKFLVKWEAPKFFLLVKS